MNVRTTETGGRSEPEEFTTATKNRTDALSALAYATTALTIAIGGYVYVSDRDHVRQELSSLRDSIAIKRGKIAELHADINGLRITVARNEQHTVEHIDRANYWIKFIQDIRSEQITNTKAIALIHRDASARADPYTGTEGRANEKRVDRLEHRVDKIEDWKDQHEHP